MSGRNERDAASPRTNPGAVSGTLAGAFEQFRAGLYSYLRQRLRNAQNAEDLSQEVYVRLLRAADLGQVRSPQAYVYRIAFNVLYEFKLRERSTQVVFDSQAATQAAEQLPDEAATPQQAYEDDAKAQQFEQVIAQLPPMQRAVLRLAMQTNQPHSEIAAQLGISVSTMRNHLYKAIDFCRHRLLDETQQSAP